jgi:hypothetical protein
MRVANLEIRSLKSDKIVNNATCQTGKEDNENEKALVLNN